MLPTLLSHCPLAYIETDSRLLFAIALPLAGIVLAGVIVVTALYFHNRRREMWHETARIALEKGQPLPPMMTEHQGEAMGERAGRANGRNDVRSGLVLIAVGGGLFIFFQGVGARQVSGVGAIPGLIGVALLLYAFLSSMFFRKGPDVPPRS